MKWKLTEQGKEFSRDRFKSEGIGDLEFEVLFYLDSHGGVATEASIFSNLDSRHIWSYREDLRQAAIKGINSLLEAMAFKGLIEMADE